MLSCHHLYQRLLFLDCLMGQKTLFHFPHISYWLLNFVFIHHILHIDILIANLMKIKEREKRITLLATINQTHTKKWSITDKVYKHNTDKVYIMNSILGGREDFLFVWMFVCLFIFIVSFVKHFCFCFFYSLKFCCICIKLLNHSYFSFFLCLSILFCGNIVFYWYLYSWSVSFLLSIVV